MPRHSVEVHPEAMSEAVAAVEWYRVRNKVAANAFVSEIDDAIERIKEAPDRWSEYILGTR